MKRIWQTADFIPERDLYIVRLDGKPLKMPSGGSLKVPFQALARAIAAEWAAAPESFTPDDLPLTRLATTAQDRVRLTRPEIIEQLSAYGMNDLLCYRAADPPALAAYEHSAWQPWLDWAATELNVHLTSGPGILPIQQSGASLDDFKAILSPLSDYHLAGLGVIVPALGSLVLGLAVLRDALDPEAACKLSQLDELWQERRWGVDNEALVNRRNVTREVEQTKAFLRLCLN